MNRLFQIMPELQGEEMAYIQNITKELDDSQLQQFANVYRARRKDPQIILLTTLLGLVVVAGVQRFLIGQIGMGILYLFTGGLCLIGTIVDLINYKELAFTFNQRTANEIMFMIVELQLKTSRLYKFTSDCKAQDTNCPAKVLVQSPQFKWEVIQEI